MTNEFDKPAKPYRPPELTAARRADISRAAHLHAEVNHSDPFARARIATHMRRGLESPSDVIAEAERRRAASASARAAA